MVTEALKACVGIGIGQMANNKPVIDNKTVAKWQSIVDIAARIVDVPASLVMKTDAPDHAVLVSSKNEDNPYFVGQSFELNPKLYCNAVLENCDELLVHDASNDPEWNDNEDLKHGMSFYIGYPLQWPDGSLFGTICVLDSRDNQKAVLYKDLLIEFRGAIESDLALLVENTERRRLEGELQKSLNVLEDRVAERTQDLTLANQSLREEITRRKKAQQALGLREKELEEVNTALRVLLTQMEVSRTESEEQILKRINDLVLPHIEKIKQNASANDSIINYIDLLESNLRQITSSFAGHLSQAMDGLTSTEVEIAQLVMSGNSTKDIANILSREKSTVDFHRNNIRKKLRIEDRARDLRTHLLSLH